MPISTLLAVLFLLWVASYFLTRRKALALTGKGQHLQRLHSLPKYYGYLALLWSILPALLILGLWIYFDSTAITALIVSELPAETQALPEAQLELIVNDIHNIANGVMPAEGHDPALRAAVQRYQNLRTISHAAMVVVVLAVSLGAGLMVWWRASPTMRARVHVERITRGLLIACSTLAIFITLGIVLSVLFEAIRFFQAVPISEFLFGLSWSPQTAIRADQVGASGAFGAVPLFTGTLLISAIAMFVAVPIGLMAAIYLGEYANQRFRAVAKPLLEFLAGIPTVVYGFFAALTMAPLLRDAGAVVGLSVSSQSALAAGLVMGVMLIPFISSLSDDVIHAVPNAMREGSYGLGATRSETIRRVIIPAALPGIVGGILLAMSRAIGETMIVVMAAGLAANLTANPFETVTTVTVQIVTLLTGDQEFDSPKTLAAFALGLTLFATTLVLNIIALHVVRKYREQYE